jgi:hypothetical protein
VVRIPHLRHVGRFSLSLLMLDILMRCLLHAFEGRVCSQREVSLFSEFEPGLVEWSVLKSHCVATMEMQSPLARWIKFTSETNTEVKRSGRCTLRLPSLCHCPLEARSPFKLECSKVLTLPPRTSLSDVSL